MVPWPQRGEVGRVANQSLPQAAHLVSEQAFPFCYTGNNSLLSKEMAGSQPSLSPGTSAPARPPEDARFSLQVPCAS